MHMCVGGYVVCSKQLVCLVITATCNVVFVFPNECETAFKALKPFAFVQQHVMPINVFSNTTLLMSTC